VRDDLRNHAVEHLGQPDGIFIVDEIGFLKKGSKSAGVSRQYCGTAGRIENCQIGVFLAYQTSRGCVFLDRRLYLPEVWTNDSTCCREAGIPENITFATKPELARQMIRDAVQSGVPAQWVTADTVYGGDSKFRQMLEAEGLDYVVAVSSAQRIWVVFEQVRGSQLAIRFPSSDWKRISCGVGTKGKRFYDWAFMPFPFSSGSKQHKGILFRRSIEKLPNTSFYLCGFKPGRSLNQLVQIAGARWSIESGFEQSKQEVGLSHHEVCTWTGCHRHITLSLIAPTFLKDLRSESASETNKKRGLRFRNSYR